MKPRDDFDLYVNQAIRDATCIAVARGKALAVYTMPRGRDFYTILELLPATGEPYLTPYSFREVARLKALEKKTVYDRRRIELLSCDYVRKPVSKPAIPLYLIESAREDGYSFASSSYPAA